MGRLLISVDARPLCSPVSGVSRIIQQVIENLQGDFWFRLHAQSDHHPDYDALVRRSDVEWSTGTGPLSRTGGTDFNIRLVRQLRQNPPDVFWGTQQVLPPMLPSRTGAVLTFHDFVAYRFPDSMRRAARWQQKAVQSYSVKRADLILANSAQTKREILERYSYDRQRIIVAHPGVTAPSRNAPEVDDAFLDQLRQTDPESLGSHRRSRNARRSPVAPFMLACSTVEPRKNYGLLLDAYERYCELGAQEGHIPLGLVIAGRKGWESDSFYSSFQEKLERLPGLHWPNSGAGVSDAELQWLYHNCAFFVIPSLYEGFGIPLLDAMAHRKPALVSDLGCFHEIAGNRAKYLPVDRADLWAHAMLDQDIALRKGKTSIRWNARDWSWKKTAQHHGEAFQNSFEMRNGSPDL